MLVDVGRTTQRQAVLIPPHAGRLQVRFPPGARLPGRLHRAARPGVPGGAGPRDFPAGLPGQRGARPGRGRGPMPRDRGSAVWHEATGEPDGRAGRRPIRPSTRRLAAPRSRWPAGARGSRPTWRSAACWRSATSAPAAPGVLPVTGCAAIARLFNDRCVTCGTSPRGRVADLTMASFVALGGDLERGCFNATVTIGRSACDDVCSPRPRAVQIPLLSAHPARRMRGQARPRAAAPARSTPGSARPRCSRSGSAARWPCSCARSNSGSASVLIFPVGTIGRGAPGRTAVRVRHRAAFLVAACAWSNSGPARPDVGCGCFGDFSPAPVSGRTLARSGTARRRPR